MICALTVFSCASKSPEQAQPQDEYVKIFQPEWYGKIQENDEYLFTYGSEKSFNEEIGYKKACNRAYSEASYLLGNYIETIIKKSTQEVSSDGAVAKYDTSQILRATQSNFRGSFISKKEFPKENDGNTCFVQLSIPKKEINKNLVNNIKKDANLYEYLKSSQTFKELEEETKSE